MQWLIENLLTAHKLVPYKTVSVWVNLGAMLRIYHGWLGWIHRIL